MIDADLNNKLISELQQEIMAWRTEARRQNALKGDDRCWLDDLEWNKLLPEGHSNKAVFNLPPKCEFLASCERFWNNRQPKEKIPLKQIESVYKSILLEYTPIELVDFIVLKELHFEADSWLKHRRRENVN